MKSRQINFFIMPDEWDALENYLIENNLISIASTMADASLSVSSIRDNELLKCLVLEKQKNALDIKKIDANTYSINRNHSPVIELRRSFYDTEQQLLRRGRLYYTKGFWNEAGEWKEKDADFMEAADKLFKWFRKTYKDSKMDDWKGITVTQRVKDRVNEGLILTQI